MRWKVHVLGCVVAAGILHQGSGEAGDLAAAELRTESGTSWSPVGGVDDPSIINDALPVAKNSHLGGNLVIMRNTGDVAFSVSFTDVLPGVKQVIDPGGSLVWSCNGDALPPVSLEVHGGQGQRTLNVICGDVLVVGGKDLRLSKYEEQDPGAPVSEPQSQARVEDAEDLRRKWRDLGVNEPSSPTDLKSSSGDSEEELE